ncbi:MAG: hypothetical protein M9934_11095 [Thermomicrobiales bacterium]|nr:hypothetical protein [Thermomicrobiales bacterium]
MHLTRRALVASSVTLSLLSRGHAFARQDEEEFVADAQNRLRTMLDYLPGGILDDHLDITWTDFEGHYAKLPGLDTDQQYQLAPASEVTTIFANRQDVQDLLGLELTSIRQGIISGLAPNRVIVLDMASDLSNLPDLWEANGYESRRQRGTSFWTIGENGEIDLENPVNRLMIARANNLAIVNDSLIVMAPRSALLAEVVETINGQRDGRAQEFEKVIAIIPQETTNLWLLNGEMVAATNPESSAYLAESDAAVGPMPEIMTLAIGQTAGATWSAESQPDDVRAFTVLQPTSPDQAEQVAAVAEWRLQNMVTGRGAMPFADVVGPVTAEVSDGVAIISTTGADDRDMYIFTKIMTNGDIAPFAYIPEES